MYDFQPWETIAGNSHWNDAYDVAEELLDALSGICREHGYRLPLDVYLEDLDDLAERDGDEQYFEDIEALNDVLIDHLQDFAILPPSCALAWNDGEFICLPFVDEFECHCAEPPEKYDGYEHCYVVNDHGNVTCYAWNGTEYAFCWDMV